MKLVGIDVGKNSHHFCVMDMETGEFNVAPSSFSNNKEEFDFLINSLKPYSKKSILLGMEDTWHRHNLKEELNIYYNRLQKSIDLVFPEFNTLFGSKYGIVYMNLLKTFGNAEAIASTDIRTIRKCFEIKGRGCRISLTPEKLKECAKNSIGISSEVETIQIKHLVSQITLIKEQIAEIDKKIEEFSITNCVVCTPLF